MGLYNSRGAVKPKTLRPMNEEGDIVDSFPTDFGALGDIFGFGDQTDGGGNNRAFTNALAQKKFELDMGKFLYQKSKDDAEAKAANDAIKLKQANAKAQYAAMQKQFDSGDYHKAFDEQLAGLQQLGDDQEFNIKSQRDTGLADIAGGYDAAGKTVDIGFNTLDKYLQNNPNNPYNDQTYGAGTVSNGLSALLSSQGASNDPVNAQLQATQGGLDAGAKEFNDLNTMLSNIAQSSADSRKSEAVIGRNQAVAGLAQQQAGQEGSLKASAADTLNKMWANITENKIGVKANAAKAKTDLETWLNENVIAADPKVGDSVVGAKPRTSFKNVVAAEHPDFKGTLEAAKKEFPKLLKEVVANRAKGKK